MAKNLIRPDPISLTTHHIHMGFNDEIIAHGTGFIYKKQETYFLITNWHNVSGRHPETGKHLSKELSEPNVICTYFRSKDYAGDSHKELIPLYSSDTSEPLWKEHPVFGHQVDVVAIPLPTSISSKYRLYTINENEFDPEYKEEVADDAFIVGYPFSDLTYIGLPVWKKASIASEPDVNINRLPMMYVDTATRPGLSGSPVIMQRVGLHGFTEGTFNGDALIGRIRNFIGIYSGRVGNDEFKAQLGIVWKAQVIEEILSSKKNTS